MSDLETLKRHLSDLESKRKEIEGIIDSVKKSIYVIESQAMLEKASVLFDVSLYIGCELEITQEFKYYRSIRSQRVTGYEEKWREKTGKLESVHLADHTAAINCDGSMVGGIELSMIANMRRAWLESNAP